MSLFDELKRRNVFRVAVAYGVIAWVLAQVADLAFDNFGAPEWVGKSVLFVLVLGFPLAVFFAWAFELTPEGLKKEKDVDRSTSITSQTGRKLNRVITVLLVIAVSLLLADKFWPASERSAVEVVATDSSEMSIAVLPFENRSNREEDEFFTQGIHDDLLTTMANIGSMKVISRTSVMEYKNTTKKIPEIARELGVANILEGGIQRSGNQVRINVQLIDARSDEHLWAEIYDRELTAGNLFAIQSEVSRAIASALKATLSPAEQNRISAVPTQNLEAYEAYLLGRQRWDARTAESTADAVVQFQKAIDLDPNFAQAYAGLADAYRHQVPYGGVAGSEVFPKAEVAVRKALALDNTLGEAHATLGGLLRQMGKTDEGEAELRRAIELNPNYSAAYNWLGLVYNTRGDFEGALEVFRKGLEIDPLSTVMQSNVAYNAGVLGRFDEMKAGFARILEVNPESPSGYRGMAAYYDFALGRFDQGLPYHIGAIEADPNDPFELVSIAFNYVALGDVETAESWLRRLEELMPDSFASNAAEAAIAAMRGDHARAYTYAKRAEDIAPTQIGFAVFIAEFLRAELAAGQSSESFARFARLFPEFGDPETVAINRVNCYLAIDYIHLLRETGNETRAEELRAELLLLLETLPEMGPNGSAPMKSLAYAMAGDNKKALSALRGHVDSGWRFGWQYYLDYHYAFESLRDEPEFGAIRAAIEADMVRQLANVRKMEASGEIPNLRSIPVLKSPPPT